MKRSNDHIVTTYILSTIFLPRSTVILNRLLNFTTLTAGPKTLLQRVIDYIKNEPDEP